MTTRRFLLRTMAAAGTLAVWDAPIRYAFASVPTDRRFVVVILRGALDGLAAVPPHGDKDYAAMRGSLAIADPLDLDGFFGLHPALTHVKAMFDAKEAAVFHNICSPYRDRSHFDGQNVLETGGSGPHMLQDGWLNRALTPLGLGDGAHALAVAQTAPLLLSGPARTTSWMPETLPAPDEAFLARVRMLYAGDPVLLASLDSAVDMQGAARAAMDDPSAMKPGQNGYGNVTPLFAGAGKLLAADNGPRIAVLDTGGWDTHFNQGAGEGQLARRLQALDAGLDGLKTALGPAWSKTAIVMATEFGRTVHVNGSGGTDHGTGGAAFVLGGAVNGGAVHAEWTGLSGAALQDGRDQPARTDLRALFKGILAEHMGVSHAALNATVFPDSGGVAAMKGLIRA
ncbi:MAG: DUF1501 domain-containing protein [Rhizomicrobium sp.]